MIYLTTGTPGAGKTLLTLAEVRDRALKEGRAVYYVGIEILKPEMFPDWVELEDATKWHELPDGSIIVHDECQTLYRPRATGSLVPEHVSKFETHRHRGYDVYLITQHPMLLDANVRRLTGEHRHVVRTFGANFATVHRWNQIKDQCDKSRSDSERVTRPYPVELFDAYKSATIHTHKRRIPKAVIFLFAVPVLLLSFVIAAVMFVKKNYIDASPAVVDQTVTQFAQVESRTLGSGRGEPATLAAWAEIRLPRVEGLPHTAPIYDEVTKPVQAPYPAACIDWEGQGCRCYTDQGTRIEVKPLLCRQIVERGFFMDWDNGRRS